MHWNVVVHWVDFPGIRSSLQGICCEIPLSPIAVLHNLRALKEINQRRKEDATVLEPGSVSEEPHVKFDIAVLVSGCNLYKRPATFISKSFDAFPLFSRRLGKAHWPFGGQRMHNSR